eukprot:TRINITY_DN7733_c0_g1_i4.p1 TRINITY_DN7733_c0_g1~~TRINITY_DN7733_c0_g1_i4.p1  ORF type:complete len:510 (+),score=98.19 TRINITY_DN7733_c0_g1_i4:263-1792(+)
MQSIGVEYFTDSPWIRIERAWAVREHALVIFKMIDLNANGLLEKREMMTALQKDQAVITKVQQFPCENIQMLCNPKHYTKMFSKIDTDHSNDISVSEFVDFFYSCGEIDQASRKAVEEFSGLGQLPVEQWDGKAVGLMLNGVAFEADFLGGRMHGQAKLQWDNGQVYEGEMRNNHIEGAGRFEFSDGSSYTGQVLNGLRSGEGTFKSDSGVQYTGGWLAGKRHGSGTGCYPNGSKYCGEWDAGLKSGKGRMDYPSGSYYEGQWEGGMREGNGTMYWANERYSGSWHQGKQHGEGEHVWLESAQREGFVNNRYKGQFERAAKHGHGTFYYSDNSVYVGQWECNQKHGQGVWREESGEELVTEFVYDKIKDQESGTLLSKCELHARPPSEELGAQPDNQMELGACMVDQDPADVLKARDLMLRAKAELAEIFKYYSGLGESEQERMYTMGAMQFCQMCKDCGVPSKMFPMSVCENLFEQACATCSPASTSAATCAVQCSPASTSARWAVLL